MRGRSAAAVTAALLLISSSRAQEKPSPVAPPSALATPSPSPSASPQASPSLKIIPYIFNDGVRRDPTPSDLLRFEDEAEVRALEMNEAIARFFEDQRVFTHGATGGKGVAPSLQEMKEYRPGPPSEAINLLAIPGAIKEVVKGIKRQIELRKGMQPAEPDPSPTPGMDEATKTPTPTPSPTPKPDF